MRVDAFRPADEFKNHMDNWISTFRHAATKQGQEAVLIPGDPERLMEAERLLAGIPLLDPVIRDLESLSQKFGIALN
jgi:LDH2 family malate/lactate/ureidoglycolate dehydrogenase